MARLEKFDKEDEMMKLYKLHMTFLEKWNVTTSRVGIWNATTSRDAAIAAIGPKMVSSAPCV